MVVSKSNRRHGCECVVDRNDGQLTVGLLVKFKSVVAKEVLWVLLVSLFEVSVVLEVLHSEAHDEPCHSELEGNEEDQVQQLNALECE